MNGEQNLTARLVAATQITDLKVVRGLSGWYYVLMGATGREISICRFPTEEQTRDFVVKVEQAKRLFTPSPREILGDLLPPS